MVLTFGDDAAANVSFADEAAAALRGRVDDYIAREGITAPPATDDPAEVVVAQLPSPPITSLDMAAHGIRTVIWCTGFDGDFSWRKVPGALTAERQPEHVHGIGAGGLYCPGLDFSRLGHSWASTSSRPSAASKSPQGAPRDARVPWQVRRGE
jgi:putative flavoprotein involved in K+ transport